MLTARSSSTSCSMLSFPQGPLERRHATHLTLKKKKKEIIFFNWAGQVTGFPPLALPMGV